MHFAFVRVFTVWFLITAFLFEQTGSAYSTSVLPAPQTHELRIPAGDFAAWADGKKKLPQVWIIEDWHGSTEAQLNIARIIGYLRELEPQALVLSEGLSEHSRTDVFDFVKNPELRIQIAYYLLKQAHITAAEYASLTEKNSFPVSGLEVDSLLRSNWQTYRRAKISFAAKQKIFEKLNILMLRLEKDLLSPGLQRWLRALREFESSSQDSQWIEHLESAVKKLPAGNLAAENMRRLLTQQISPDSLPADAWIENIRSLFESAILIEARSELEIKTAALLSGMRKLIRFYRLEAAREDYLSLSESNESLFSRILQTAETLSRRSYKKLFSDSDIAVFKSQEAQARLFHRTALLREKAFEKKALLIRQTHQNHPLVLVMGGFHSRPLQQRLEHAGIRTAVLQPKVHSLAADRHYEKRALRADDEMQARSELLEILILAQGAALTLDKKSPAKKTSAWTAAFQSQTVNAPSSLKTSLLPQPSELKTAQSLWRVSRRGGTWKLIPAGRQRSEIRRPWGASAVKMFLSVALLALMSACTSVQKNKQAGHRDGFYNPYAHVAAETVSPLPSTTGTKSTRIRLEAPPAPLPEPDVSFTTLPDGSSDITLTADELAGFKETTPPEPDLSAANLLLPLPQPDDMDSAEVPLTSKNYDQLPRIIVKNEKLMEGAVCPLCFLLSDEEKEELIQSGAMAQINSYEDAFKTADEALNVLFSYKGKGKKFSENERYKAVLYLSAFHAEKTRLRALELLRDSARPDFTEGKKEFVRGIIVGAVQWVLFAGPNQEDIQALMNYGLSHPDNLVRFMTTRLLGKIAEKDPEKKIFTQAMREKAGQVVVQILQSDPDLFPAIAAAKALPEIIGGEAATLYIDQALAREKTAKRYYILDAAVDSAAKFPSAKYVENLLEILKMKPPLDGTKDANDRSKILWNYQKLKLKARTALINIFNMDAIGPGASNANQRKWDGTDMFSVMVGTGDALHQFLALGNEMLGKSALASKLRVWIRDLQGVAMEDPLPEDHALHKQNAQWFEQEKQFRIQVETKNPDKYKAFMRRAFLKDSTTRLDTGYLMKTISGTGIDSDFVRLAAGLAIEHHALDLQEALAENIFFQQNSKTQAAALKALIHFTVWEKDSGIMVYDSDYFQRLRDLIDLALDEKTVRVPWVSGGFWYNWTDSLATKKFKLTPENRELLQKLFEIITGEAHSSAQQDEKKSAAGTTSQNGSDPTQPETPSQPANRDNGGTETGASAASSAPQTNAPTSLVEPSSSTAIPTEPASPKTAKTNDLVLHYAGPDAVRIHASEIVLIPTGTSPLTSWNDMASAERDNYNKRLNHTLAQAKLIAEINPDLKLNIMDAFHADRTAPPSTLTGRFLSIFASAEKPVSLPRNLKIVSTPPCKACINVRYIPDPAAFGEDHPDPKPLFDAIQQAINDPSKQTQNNDRRPARLLLAGSPLGAGVLLLGLLRSASSRGLRRFSTRSHSVFQTLKTAFFQNLLPAALAVIRSFAGRPLKSLPGRRFSGGSSTSAASLFSAPAKAAPSALSAERSANVNPSPANSLPNLKRRRFLTMASLSALATVMTAENSAHAAPWDPISIPELPQPAESQFEDRIVLRTLWGLVQRSPKAQAARVDLLKQINEGRRLRGSWSLSLLAKRDGGSTRIAGGIARSGIDGLSFDLGTAYETKGLSLISNVTAALLSRVLGVKRQAVEAQQSLAAAAHFRLQEALLTFYNQAAGFLIDLHYSRSIASIYQKQIDDLNMLLLRAQANSGANFTEAINIRARIRDAGTEKKKAEADAIGFNRQLLEIIAPSQNAAMQSVKTSAADMQNHVNRAEELIKNGDLNSNAFREKIRLASQSNPTVLTAYYAYIAAVQQSSLWSRQNRASLNLSLGGFLDAESKAARLDGADAAFNLNLLTGSTSADQLLTKAEIAQTSRLGIEAQNGFASAYFGAAQSAVKLLEVRKEAAGTIAESSKILPGGPWYTAGTALDEQVKMLGMKVDAQRKMLEAEAAAVKAVLAMDALTPDLNISQNPKPKKRSELRRTQFPMPAAAQNQSEWKNLLQKMRHQSLAVHSAAFPSKTAGTHIVDTALLDVHGLEELVRSYPNAFWIFLLETDQDEKKEALAKALRHHESFHGILIQSSNPYRDAAEWMKKNQRTADSIAVGMDNRVWLLPNGLRILANRQFWLRRVRSPDIQLEALKLVFSRTGPPNLARGSFTAEQYLPSLMDWLAKRLQSSARTSTSV